MRKRAGVILAVLALGPALPGAAFASGYAIYEQGARAMANAGAFTARADDPSALFFNPAGIVQLKGRRFNFGTNAIFLTGSSFDSDLSGNSFDQADNMAWPLNMYYTQTQGDRYAWGVSITSPFGLKTQWPSNFDGRYISRESNLAVLNFNANFAWTFAKTWSAAIGVDFARADIRELSRNIDFSGIGAPDGFTTLSGTGDDVGWNLAMRWANEKGWRWGGSFRSKMNPKVDGDIKFENIPGAVAGFFPDGPAMAHLPLPMTFATGVGYAKKKWDGEFDIVWTDWSEFDHLRVDIENNTGLLADIDQTEEWHDTYSFRLGYAYHISDRHTCRLGAYLDRNPIPDDHVRPRIPDADRTSVQVGYGYTGKGKFSFDVAYQALFFDNRTVTTLSASASDPVIPGEYENFTSLLGVNLGWKFGK
jgi:long-chain fatty acid transport protein